MEGFLDVVVMVKLPFNQQHYGKCGNAEEVAEMEEKLLKAYPKNVIDLMNAYGFEVKVRPTKEGK